jgi:DNA-binding CsgD family transcriptional regulator
VGASPQAIGLTELSSTRFVALSRRGADLLGIRPDGEPGLTYLAVAERPREAAEAFRLAREGMLDGVRTRRRYRRPDGSMVEIESSGWAIRSSGPDLGLWVPHVRGSETDPAATTEGAVTAANSWHPGRALDGARVTLDDAWRIAHVTTDHGLVLGRPPAELLATSVLELTHPDDLAALLLAFARATTQSHGSVRVRLRHHDRTWRASHVAPTVVDGDQTLGFALGEAVDDVQATEPDVGERLRLELLRLATGLRAGDTVPRRGRLPDSTRLPALAQLTSRESEILDRLMDGDRVPSIAADLFLSQSTVRHHLSSIFAKIGVHSQAELIRRLRSA